MPKETMAALELIRLIAEPEDLKEAIGIAREHLKLTPEKLALMLVRLVNPDEVIGETDEARLRGMSPTTLRAMKERHELPKVVNG